MSFPIVDENSRAANKVSKPDLDKTSSPNILKPLDIVAINSVDQT